MVKDSNISAGKSRSTNGQNLDQWIFRDRETLEKKFGLEMERILELYKSDKGKEDLLKRMKEADPSLNGNVDKALQQVTGNAEQLKKKETFFKKMRMLPIRAAQAVGRTMKKHSILTAVAVTAIIVAILYFMPALAPTAGEYGTRLIQAFKVALSKIGIGTPEAATDIIGSLPVTGGSVSGEVVSEAGEILQSPGAMDALRSALEGVSQ